MRDVLVLFPGALGDFVCALPALLALRSHTRTRLTVAAKPSLLELLPRDTNHFSIDRREVVDLFASAPLAASTRSLFSRFTHIHSWTGHGDANFAQRLQAASGAVVAIHPFRAMRAHEHASRYYARCVDTMINWPAIAIDPAGHGWSDAKNRSTAGPDTLVIHAGSGSPTKNWTGFARLAERWRVRGDVTWIVGPADDRIDTPPDDTCVRDLPLPRVATLLQNTIFVGNDSGISHLAGAVGARGLALFGPTDPSMWQPLGLHVLYTPHTCAACGPSVFCTHRLPADAVYDVLRALAVSRF